ncbi:MAG: RNA polymerase sigma-70 factor [Bacteroidaceae bacterium]|nr:RNA polymerase sigma-70 factor [Bacteroidaceae bacterium]
MDNSGNILISLINAHDISGYKELYHRYYKALVMHAEGIVGDILMAEDIVENVVVVLWNSNKTFDDIKSFEAYLYRAVHNMAMNELKHSAIVNSYEQNVMTSSHEAMDEYDEEYELQIVKLMEYVDELPERMREVINKSMQGMTAKQIAEHLKISVETVKTHKKRALKMLREAFCE